MVDSIMRSPKSGPAPDKPTMPALRKRSLQLAGHRTSIALEPEFWAVLEAMAKETGASLASLVLRIDAERGERPLASACRLAALAYAGAR